MGEGLISVQFIFPFIFLSSHYPPLCLGLLLKGLSGTYSLVAGCLQSLESATVMSMVGDFGHVILEIWLFWLFFALLAVTQYSSLFSLSLHSGLPTRNFLSTSKSHHLVLCWIFSVGLYSHTLWSYLWRVNMGTVLPKPSGILGFKLGLLTVSQSKDWGVGV